YVQVHPAFLYEILWNLILLIVILGIRRRKKFQGEIFLIYLTGYGMGRFWIEGIRTDQLLISGTNQVSSVV
ncbi:Prolipoprotein diacylglyceryl transferase, partial [human gut metagenome]